LSDNDDPLKTYLEDHLAGAASAVELLSRLRDERRDEPVGRFASEILAEIEEDRQKLEELARRVDSGPHPLKNAAAKLGEKLSRLKLSDRTAGPLGILESLEFLALGVWGKRALWRALATCARPIPGLELVELDLLISRAESQHDRIENQRLEAAKVTLTAPRT
jgi:hypothetical protein